MASPRTATACTALILAAAATSACTSTHSSPATPASAAATTAPAAAPVAPAPAATTPGPGGTATLTAPGGQKITVTLVKILDPATPTDPAFHPSAGHRIVAAQIRIHNDGTTTYTLTPATAVRLTDTDGQSYAEKYALDTGAGPDFPPGPVSIAPGATAQGALAITMPTAAKTAGVQIGVGTGQTGQWKTS